MSALEEVVGEWLAKAADDLRAAHTLIALEPPLIEPAAFHCQQAAEKAMKAVLVRNGVDPEKTHDLTRIAGSLLKHAPQLDALVTPLLFLSDWAVRPRYPDLKAWSPSRPRRFALSFP